MPINYFSSKSAAERYAAGRPDFHNGTISKIKDFLHLNGKLDTALDVACGTGLSTKALLSVANEVYGTDLSAEMLNAALEKGKIKYAIARAENQPFEADTFDLITVSSGVHWFTMDAFLNEANRLLKQGAWLVIYENFFSGQMEGNDAFKTWVDQVYLRRFPPPPRNKHYDWTPDHLSTKGFAIQIPENFTNQITFSKEQLISYLTTQSNIIAVVEKGDYTYLEIELWLSKSLEPFFEDGAEKLLVYGNWIKYLQKIN